MGQLLRLTHPVVNIEKKTAYNNTSEAFIPAVTIEVRVSFVKYIYIFFFFEWAMKWWNLLVSFIYCENFDLMIWIFCSHNIRSFCSWKERTEKIYVYKYFTTYAWYKFEHITYLVIYDYAFVIYNNISIFSKNESVDENFVGHRKTYITKSCEFSFIERSMWLCNILELGFFL